MKLRKTLAGILGAVVMLLGVGTFEHVNKETGVHAVDGKYVKVTTAPSDWSGDYLIVYEGGDSCFNGSLSTLDAVSNFVSVTISNDEISIDDAYKFTIEKNGDGYAVKSAGGYYIGQTSDANGLKSSTTTKYTHTIEINADSSVNLISGGAYLRYNATSGQDRFRYYKSSSYSAQKSIHLYKLLEEGSTEPDTPETPDYDKEVNDLFSKYYNNGSYVKESVLNTNITTDEEIAKYFHAKAAVKERTTWYNSNGLTMYTDETDGNGISTYENKNGVVYHTGLGGNWTVNTPVNGLDYVPATVEEMFITLKDFVEANSTGWEFADGVYTYNLSATTLDNGNVNEDSMTTMAREFVAPMWLAPTTTSYAYVKYTKLTVQEVNEQLVMRLYVSKDNEGLLSDKESLMLSEIIIDKANDAGEYIAHLSQNSFGTSSNIETATLGNLSWTVKMDEETTPSNGASFVKEKGQQFGKSGASTKSMVLTSNVVVFADTFSISTSGAVDINATFTVKIGDTIIAEDVKVNEYATDYKFEIGEKVYGKVSIEYKQTSSKALYIKTLALNVNGYSIELPDEVEGTVYAINYEDNEKTFKVTPEEGYRVLNVTADNAAVTVDGNTFTLSNIVGNTSIEIEYEKIPTYNVTITGAEVTGETTGILEGTPVKYTVTVPEGKIIKSITANEQTVGFDGNTFTLTIMSNTNVVVTLEDAAAQPKTESETKEIFATGGTLSGTTIKWTATNFTYENAKHESSTAIRTSDSNHYRSYVGSLTTISGSNITKIEINCVSSYVLKSADLENCNVSVVGTKVTITFDTPTDSYQFVTSKQWRITSITVYYQV